MDYKTLVEVYLKLEKTTKRLEKTDILAEFLRGVSEKELSDILCLLQGRVFPLWDERKIGMSSRLMLKTIAVSTGVASKDVEASWMKLGDLGKVAEFLTAHKKQQTLVSSTLTIKKVLQNLRKLPELEGEGTVNKKVGLVSELLTSAKREEARFITGTVLEVLRVGIAEGTIRDAIAKAFNKDVKDVENAVDLLVDYGEVAVAAKKNKLKVVEMKPGKPLKLMLAILVKDVAEGFKVVGKPAAIEYKYDGFRLQIHKKNDDVTLFTRRMENVTKQFPELVKFIKEGVKAKSCILDAEAVGFSKTTKKYLPFQTVSQRIRRKYNINEMSSKFPVELNIFDVLYYENKSLVKTSLKERRKVLEKIIKEKEKKILLSKQLISKDKEAVNKFYKKSLKEGHEGVMFKSLEAPYKPGRYVGYMVKLKEMMETVDLVIVGAEWGEGKRAQWLSSYVVACRSGSELLTLGKVATGLKEKEEQGVTFKQMTEELKPLVVSEKGKIVTLKPKVIVEIGYEEIQKSPKYSSGFALRFPKVLKVRWDKSLTDCNTLEDIKRLFSSQKGKK